MVNVAEISASAHSCPFERNVIRLGLGRNIKRDIVFVRVITDDGRVGYGEAHHGQNPTAMAEIVRGIGSLLIGADPLDSEGIWDRVNHQQIVTHGLGAGSIMALSGIDIALWDLKGKILGQPVYRLMGGAQRKVRAYAGGLSLGFQPLDSLAKEVAALLAQGYTAIKMRVGDTTKRDAERVGHIRKTFGDALDIAVDAATRYAEHDIPAVVRYCEENRVYWIEEPFTPDNIPAYQKLARHTAIPLAAGENHYARPAFRALFEARAIAIVQPDCCKSGGLSEVKKIAEMAAAWHLPLAPHTSHSIISNAASVHLLSALPNGLIYEADVAPVNPFRTELATVPFGVVDGYIEPRDAPGLGIEINEAVLAAYPAIPGPCYVP
ncbi:MAG: mandelate racemase/muconate lactonizing enzyme family protein [Alphaproteobacteria bacterium]|nr:mandelate racemase/muconate lactonizing enzyme family protein [Alphaproteobacteria bacterium]